MSHGPRLPFPSRSWRSRSRSVARPSPPKRRWSRPAPAGSVSDLVAHLGGVHRYLIRVIRQRLAEPPDPADLTFLELPADIQGWPMPEHAPNRGPVPVGLIDWFAHGAAALESLFTRCGPGETVWTWSQEQTTGFWFRMQAIEAAGRPERARSGPAGRRRAGGRRRRADLRGHGASSLRLGAGPM